MEELNTKKYILEKFSDALLENNHTPKNVFSFCRDNTISEKDFYQYFANFEEVEKEYLVYFFNESLSLIIADENYLQLHGKEKLLSLYYTYFEQLTLNRSLILYIFKQYKNPLKQMAQLTKLKPVFLNFIHTLELESFNFNSAMKEVEKLAKLKKKGVEEIFWGNFAATLKFWMEDTSASFEKTDIFIEKSVAASLELTEAQPFQKLIDFGKFMWKEKISKYKS